MKCPYCYRRVYDMPDHLAAKPICSAKHKKRLRLMILNSVKKLKQDEEARPAPKSAPKETEEAQKHLTTAAAQNNR